MNQTKNVLNADEQVLHISTPQRLPYLFDLIVFVLFGTFFAGTYFFIDHTPENMKVVWAFVGIGTLIATLPVVYSILVYRYIHYTFTDKRLIIQGGLIGRDYDFVDYDKIQHMSVDVGVIDKIFGRNSGTILVDAGRIKAVENGGSRSWPYSLRHISEPYETMERLKKISFDVKTDVNFPNAMRPDTNKGYSTSYSNK